MSKPWNEWDFDYLWHFLAGGGLNGLIVWGMVEIGGPFWVPFIVVGLLFSGGVTRELGQHEWDVIGLTPHQWLEGILWGVGGLVPAFVGLGWLL